MNSPKKFLKDLPKLSKVAQKEWGRILDVTGEGNFNDLDFCLLYDYSKTFGEVIALEEELEKEGCFLTSDKGTVYGHPKLYHLNARRTDLSKLRRDLNLTPKARQEKGNSQGKSIEPEDLLK